MLELYQKKTIKKNKKQKRMKRTFLLFTYQKKK